MTPYPLHCPGPRPIDNLGMRRLLQHAPYEFIAILANSETYGGGGIYKLYSTVAADSGSSEYLMVHEFGHHFAALADEYYTSAAVYEASRPSCQRATCYSIIWPALL